MIERNILIGLITSTEFLQRIQDKWEVSLLESPLAKRVATWVKEYYEKYNKAPGKEIEPIFYQKVKNGLPKDLAETIEEDLLPGLSEQYEQEGTNVDYLVDQALSYFNERNLLRHSDEVRALVETNQLIEAESKASSYQPMSRDAGTWVDLSDVLILDKIKKAFNNSAEVLIEFPRALGDFWNHQLIRGGFVALMATEKRGKTFWLLEFALRACKQKRKVAFFQAGDMSESEQLIRTSIYLTKKSNKELYSGEMLEPIRDCIHNQLNSCKRSERECDFGIFEEKTDKYLRKEISLEELKKKFQIHPDYKTCTNCKEFESSRWGTVWMQEVNTGNPLTYKEAQSAFEDYFIKFHRQFKISTHANGTLSVKESSAIMDVWEKQEGFVPDVILYDYPDIMTDPTNEFRHKQNEIWKALRGVSQKRHALVITVTQTDADAYDRDLLSLKNFSEDKRKFAHVTAMYGLNQDHIGREKELGIMRINEIVVREGDFNTRNQIHILQNLRRGRPFLGSYW